ncbi:MAG: hypothetical protein K6T85_05280 [Gorillibacterium sp.]|nr:hypothetical protein [Gorillibacterium sp.]
MKRPTEQQFTEQLKAMYIDKYGETLPIHALIKLKQLREFPTETIDLLQEVGQHYKILVSEVRTSEYVDKGTFLIRDYYELLLLAADHRKEKRIRKWKLGFIAVMLIAAIYFIAHGQGVFSLAVTMLGMEIARELNGGRSHSV